MYCVSFFLGIVKTILETSLSHITTSGERQYMSIKKEENEHQRIKYLSD